MSVRNAIALILNEKFSKLIGFSITDFAELNYIVYSTFYSN
jgi:hypothetical protein